MAINSVATVIEYDCDGATTRFPITFTYLADTNIIVKHYDDSTQTLSDLANPAGYEVVSDEVETVATYPIDDKIFITLDMDFMQETDLEPNGKIGADVLDLIHDKLTLMCQQLRLETDSVIGLEVPEPDADMDLPNASLRASRYLAFDALGNATVVSSVDVGTVTISAYGETVVAAANASALQTIADVYSTTEVDSEVSDIADDVINLAGVGRTTETVKQNADDITSKSSLLSRMIVSNWYANTASTANSWLDVAWSPSEEIFVAVSGTGTGTRVMTSPDGVSWTTRTSAADVEWRTVVWVESLGLFIAVANAVSPNNVMTSPTGEAWTIRTGVGDGWNGGCWSEDESLFVAVGDTGATQRVMTSSNGTSWTLRTCSSAVQWQDVAYSSSLGIFAAVGLAGVMSSIDGLSWTTRTAPAANAWRGVCYSDDLGLFVAVSDSGSDHVITSNNGTSWTSRAIDAGDGWQSVTWASDLGLFVAVADSGTHSRIMTSEDGINWIARTAAETAQFAGVAYSPELSILCAVGVDAVQTTVS